MTDKFVKIGQTYIQGEIINVRHNLDIKKYNSTDTYKATQIDYYDLEGNPKNLRVSAQWLSYDYQKELVQDINSLKPGDKFTAYREKSAPATAIEGLSEAQIREKKIGNWGLSAVFQGHIRPPQMNNSAANDKPSNNAGKDVTGIQKGHAIKAAYALLSNKDAQDADKVISTACKLHDITQSVIEHYKEVGKVNEYEASVGGGMAVQIACKHVNNIKEVEVFARDILEKIEEKVLTYIKNPKETEKKETTEAEEDTAEGFDDDLPF